MTTQPSLPASPTVGHVRITFDAGGRGCSVDSNPQVFMLSESNPDRFTARWKITEHLNTLDTYTAQIANVVPCDLRQLPEGYAFVSKPVIKDNGVSEWIWTFTRRKNAQVKPPAAMKPAEILYDVFFSYAQSFKPLLPPGVAQTVSLRQVIGLDPSMVLPPKKSGGGLIPPGGKSGKSG